MDGKGVLGYRGDKNLKGELRGKCTVGLVQGANCGAAVGACPVKGCRAHS